MKARARKQQVPGTPPLLQRFILSDQAVAFLRDATHHLDLDDALVVWTTEQHEKGERVSREDRRRIASEVNALLGPSAAALAYAEQEQLHEVGGEG